MALRFTLQETVKKSLVMSKLRDELEQLRKQQADAQLQNSDWFSIAGITNLWQAHKVQRRIKVIEEMLTTGLAELYEKRAQLMSRIELLEALPTEGNEWREAQLELRDLLTEYKLITNKIQSYE